jgi:hypothetical protein
MVSVFAFSPHPFALHKIAQKSLAILEKLTDLFIIARSHDLENLLAQVLIIE